ncbi:MAG: transcriptional regulator with XRE-family HTH domain [Flavobacteriales bacterium]|jgi:transcriptional regulator with XRE-family HTH domain
MLFKKLDGEILIEVGEKLRQLRLNKKYTQEELAQIVGVNRRLIGEIEAGKGTSLLVFVKILKAFNKTDNLLEILKSSSISPREMFREENR